MRRTLTNRLHDSKLRAVQSRLVGRLAWREVENLHIQQIEADAAKRSSNLSPLELKLVKNIAKLPYDSNPKNALQFFFSTAKSRLMNYGSTWTPPPPVEKIRILHLSLLTPRKANCDLTDVIAPDKPALHVYYFDEESCDIGKFTMEFLEKNKFRLGHEKICLPSVKGVENSFPELPKEVVELANDLVNVSRNRTR